MTALTGPWRFHGGDDAAWSNPDLDDRDWSLLSTEKAWSEQGYQGYGGFGWYRIRIIEIPAQYKNFAFYLPSVDDSCEIYANGKLIGGVGLLPPNPKAVQESRALFPIPDSAVVAGRPLVLAIRVWRFPLLARFAGGGIYPAPRIGEASAIAEWRQLQERNVFWQSGNLMLDLFGDTLAALTCLGLFVMRPREREYLWFGLYQTAWAVYQVTQLHFTFLSTPVLPWSIAQSSLFVLAFYTGLEFFCAFLGQRSRWLYWGTILFIIGLAFVHFYSVFNPGVLPSTFEFWCLIGYFACLIAMLYLGVRNGNQDALLVLIPNALQLLNWIGFIVSIFFLSRTWAYAFFHFEFDGIHWPFPLNIPQILGDIEMVAVLIILIRRFARSRRDEERLESELEAARIVQQVLVPAEIPPIPGFRIESVYRPAGQVGGDFFQIIPTALGGALVAVGDVSGKGLPAAMTVSLLVGTFRTLAHYTQSPSEILAAMNLRMLARSQGGFTTCLVLRADRDGTLTFANAGHLAPFVNGEELKVENGLPLGLSADSTYPESSIQFEAVDQLTVVTDGVVEARSKDGELFGFARTQGISRRPANEIAGVAQSFGQEDDITVLTLACAGIP